MRSRLRPSTALIPAALLVSTLLAIPAQSHAGEASARSSAVLLLKVSTPGGTRVNFGASSDVDPNDPIVALFRRSLTDLGIDMVAVEAGPVAVTPESGGLAPLGDRAALDLARASGANSAWIVGIESSGDGRIRGTSLAGAAGNGEVRVLAVDSGDVIASARSGGASFDSDGNRAAMRAAAEIAGELVAAVAQPVASRWPRQAGGWSKVVVQIRGARTWSPVSAIIHKLGSTEGVGAVHARSISAIVDLAVDTERSAAAMASTIERARLIRGSARARAAGSQVIVDIHGDAPLSDDLGEIDAPD